MQLRIIKSGVLSTVQDLGRTRYRSQAVPVSGAMDTTSARIANIAVGNDDNAAVIEFTYANASFKAETELLIAYSGSGAALKAGTQMLPADRPIFIPEDTTVELINNPDGCRSYLAIAGGWEVPLQLDSRSTYVTAALGGFRGRALMANDALGSNPDLSPISIKIIENLQSEKINFPKWSLRMSSLLPADKKEIRIVPAREFVWFQAKSIVDFLSTPYQLSTRSNRMGYHLEGAAINRLVKKELLSTAVTPGTLQVTGDGSMILLMADCQTTGGYPRIAQVAAVDLPLCGQLKPGDSIFFKEISREEAEMLYIEREKQLGELTRAVKHRFLYF